MQSAADQYAKYGRPAQDAFYQTVQKYSAPQEFERQAALAKGDVGAAVTAQQGDLARRNAALGISANSPAAVAERQQAATQSAAIEAGAMNRARNTARNMGIQLQGDAANFASGGQGMIQGFGSTAQNAATGAFGVANAALSGANQSAAVPMQGYGLNLSALNNNTDVWAKLGAANISADASTSLGTGLGRLFGTLGSAGSNSVFGSMMSKLGMMALV
jgi:hypothetical protein